MEIQTFQNQNAPEDSRWTAINTETYEEGSPQGLGPTPAVAINDLVEQLLQADFQREHVLALQTCSRMIRTWLIPEFPCSTPGKQDFIAAVLESVADTIDAAIGEAAPSERTGTK